MPRNAPSEKQTWASKASYFVCMKRNITTQESRLTGDKNHCTKDGKVCVDKKFFDFRKNGYHRPSGLGVGQLLWSDSE